MRSRIYRPINTLCALFIVGCVAWSGNVRADTFDETRFNRLIKKYAITIEQATPQFKPKAACVCLDGGVLHNLPGFVFMNPNDTVVCGVPGFTNGDVQGWSDCLGDWEILAK